MAKALNGAAMPKKSKNQIRRERAKLKKQQHLENENNTTQDDQTMTKEDTVMEDVSERNVTIHEPDVDQLLDNPMYAQFKSVFNRFYTEEAKEVKSEEDPGQIFYSDDEDEKERSDNDTQTQNISKSKRKLKKIPLPRLKALAPKPELVEWFDADSTEPLLLAQIKACHGVVPVPDHWQLKREYLSARRGIKKAAFELPQFIKDTGIMDMRDALKEDEKTLRQKTRERVQPKMGRLDIDYQKLYNAFFRFQTKPRLYMPGEIYYEGKEDDLTGNLPHFRPGKLSNRLKDALNIPPGAPPPWLLSMQRHGPPPSYHGLRIPGLNAPIPQGAQWGYQPGGYGKPPVDEKGDPIYGDVYGLSQQAKKKKLLGAPVEKTPWGEIQDYEEDEEEDEEEQEGNDDEEEVGDDGQGYVDEETALAAETREQQSRDPDPGPIELRKQKRTIDEDEQEADEPEIHEEYEDDDGDRKLYEVLKEKKGGSNGFMGTQSSYEIPSDRKRKRFEEKPEDITFRSKTDFQRELDELVKEESKKARN
jgi:splicing factor 3B subunit 2